MRPKKLLLKSIASILTLALSYSQVLWAADVRQMLLDAKQFFEEQDALKPRSGMSPEELRNSEAQQQAVAEQQQMLEDFQNTAFNLTTQNGDILKYVGNKLDSVTRPDGTRLDRITTDLSGNILNADLRLADGSIQIYQNGQVVGYQLPDGSQVIYQNGAIQKVISPAGVETLYTFVRNAQGAVTETLLDNPSYLVKYDANNKIKEATRKSDGQKIYYANGIIQRIVNADGSEILFSASTVNGDTVVTPQGSSGANAYTDPSGNKFTFVSGAVSKIELTDGSTLDNIVWDANNKIDSANLTQTDGARFIYQLKKLTRSYDVLGVVTNYTYTATGILAVTAGNTFEYLLDKTPVKYTALNGDGVTYNQTGTYKGYKNTETVSGVTYVYSYQGTGASLVVQKKQTTTALLPITLYQTSARSLLSWNNGQAWFSYEQAYGKDYLQTHWAGQWLEYTVNMSQTGDLKIDLQASDSDTLPTGYANFMFDFSVDGTLKGTMSVPAGVSSAWKNGTLTLTGLSQGNHVIRLKFANFASASSGKTDPKIRNIAFTRSSTTTTTVTNGYQSTPLTARVDTVSASTIVKPAAPPTGINSTDFTSITYDSLSNLKQVLFKDGTKLIFDKGVLKQSFDASGKQTDFNFSQSALANITGTSIVQSNLTSTYSAEGKLSSIVVGGMTAHYKEDGATVKWIEKTDGTELWDPVFDASGNLTGALIVSPDGEERTYLAGKLVQLRRPDESRLFYANNQVTKMITPEKLTYNFNYTVPGIVQAILDTTVIPAPDALTPVKLEYDTNFNLKKVTRQNLEVINYLNNQVDQISAPNTAAKVFAYQKDASGNILSYTVTQGNTVTTYDANNQPVSAVINPDASNPNALSVAYQYGKIRQIKKNGVATFNYSYAFDAAGTEMTVVEDLEENTTKTYAGGDLVSSLDKANSVLSSYSYSGGQVSRVKVSRFGRELHSYDYSYSGTDTLVKDEQGVIRTYDVNKKLTFLEKDGQKFAYTYSTQTVTVPGTTTTQETTLPVSLYDATLSTKSWDGQVAWASWERPYGKDYLVTYWADQWVQYTANMSQAGGLKINLEMINDGALPTNYSNFQIQVLVDGVDKGTYSVAASSSVWQAGVLNIAGVSQGSHAVRLKFVNFTYDAAGKTNFKFRNISFKQVVTTTTTTTTQQEIVSESLVEKRTADGTLVHYSQGKVTQIDRPDGKILKNIVRDASTGQVTEARLYAGPQDTVGNKLHFMDGAISKVTLATGQELLYSYDKTASGAVTNVWVQKGAAHLKYNAQGNLEGLRIDGVMSPEEILAVTTHAYSGGNGGFLGHDGNPLTAQTGAFGGGTGNSYTALTAEHTFPEPNAVTQFSYRLDTSAYSSGSTNNGSGAAIYLETKDATTGLWTTVPGTYAAQSHSNGGGGGSTAFARTPGTGLTTISVNIPNVIAVRAYAVASAYSNGGGNYGGQAYIYELQFNLADESSLTYSSTTASGSQAGGYNFSGYVGQIAFDAVGNLTQGDPDLALIQQELTGVVQNYAKVPYFGEAVQLDLLTADAETVVLQEYSADGTLETQTKADGTVTLFDNGKPSRVLDAKGETLIQYTYDAAGNPSRVYLKNARDTLPDEVAKARLAIESQRAASLRNLAAQKNLSYQSIQAQFQNARIVLEAQQASQQGLYNNISSSEAKGKQAKAQMADALQQVGQSLDQILAQLTGLYDQEADAYAALDTQVKALSDQIDADSQTAVSQLAAQEVTMKKEILRQEVSPIVYDYYRRLLGRDPDTAEYNYWIGKIDYNSGATLAESKTTDNVNLTAALNSYLTALPELAERQAYVNTIKTNVAAQVNSYLAMTQTQKEAFAATLGLTAQDTISLSSEDASKILTWLNSRSLHFGQSAFLALESLLDQKGKTYTRTDLAQKAILIDILSGVISPLDDGDLVLSIFALNKTAKLYSVDLTGANLSWDDLKAVVPATASAASPRMIAHINGNHFVVITAMTDTSITYTDMGKGKDKSNESITVSKADFLKVWKGNVTLESVILSAAQQREGSQARALSVEEAKSIRGAFLPLLFAFAWSAIQSVGFAVAAVGSWITTTLLPSIGSLVANVVKGVGFALSKMGEGLAYIGHGLFEGIKFAASTLFGQFGNPLASASGQNLIGSLTKASFGDVLFQTAVKVGFSVATQKGLQALGVNPVVASLASAFVTGGITNGFNSSFAAQNFIQGGVKALGLQGLQTVMQNANIDTTLSQTLLTIASPFIDGIQTGTIGGATINIIKDIPKLAANYGLQKAGGALGLSPTMSQLIAAPLAVSLGAGFQNGNLFGQDLVYAVQQSITMGAVAYGLELVGQSHPVLGSLLSSDIIKGIALVIGKNGLFDKVFDFLGRTALNVFNVIGGTVQSIFNGVTDFGQEIQQKGLAGALQDNLQSFFGRSAQEAILAKGGVQNVANLPKTQVTLPGGLQALEAKIDANNSLYYNTQGNLIGKKEMGDIQIGTFGKDASRNKVALTNGTVYSSIDGMNVVSEIENGQAMTVQVFDQQGQEVVGVISDKLNTPLKIEGPENNGSAAFWDSVIKLVSFGASFTIGQGVAQAAEIGMGAGQGTSTPVTQNVLYALVNGIFNTENDPNNAPTYINNLEHDIALNSNGQIVEGRDFIKSSIYQGMGVPVLDHAKDIFSLAVEAMSPVLHFIATMKIIADFDFRFSLVPSDKTRPMVAMGYSGGLLPLIEAIRQKDYNAETLVGLGAATTAIGNIPFEDMGRIASQVLLGNFSQAAAILLQYFTGVKDLSATHVKRVVNVWGTNDDLYKLGISGKRDSIGGVAAYNIEILGAAHDDYMRRDESDPIKRDLNLKVSQFVEDLMRVSNDPLALEGFLNSKCTKVSDRFWRFSP